MGTKITHDYSAFKKRIWRALIYAIEFTHRFFTDYWHNRFIEEIPHMTVIPRMIFLASIVKNDEAHYQLVQAIHNQLRNRMRVYSGHSIEQWYTRIFPLISDYYKMRAIQFTRNPRASISDADFLQEDLKLFIKCSITCLFSKKDIRSAEETKRKMLKYIKEEERDSCFHNKEVQRFLSDAIKSGLNFAFLDVWLQHSLQPIEKRTLVGTSLISVALAEEALYPFVFRVLRDIESSLVKDAQIGDRDYLAQANFVMNRKNDIAKVVYV